MDAEYKNVGLPTVHGREREAGPHDLSDKRLSRLLPTVGV